MAFTAGLEHTSASIDGDPSTYTLRATQVYRREGDTTYRYESGGGAFLTMLEVNAAGFVIDYRDFWRAESSSS